MEIKTGSTVTLEQAQTAILVCGSVNTMYLRGEPGVGKSSILFSLCSEIYNPNAPLAKTHLPAYIDCSDKELGDLAIPDLDREAKCTRYLPNSIFNIHLGKPVVVMLDELGKAPQPVKNMLLPLIQERRLGDTALHPDSIVFATSNLTSDGVGDSVKAHELNRVTELIVRKPDAKAWIAWAHARNALIQERQEKGWKLASNGGKGGFNVNTTGVRLNEILMGWVNEYPHALDSYLQDGKSNNPYIFNPTKGAQKAFVSPRSLEKASHILNNRDKLGPDLTIAMLIGTVGESAARDMAAYVTVADKLVRYEDIIKDPKKVKVPNDAVAVIIQCYTFLSRVTKNELSDLMDYIVRLPKETQSLFATSLTRIEGKRNWVMLNQKFVAWARENAYLFT